MKQSEINFKIQLDENNLPVHINWEAPEAGEKNECKSVMLAMWDGKDQNTLRIDLWTKDMTMDEMKKFFHQSLLSMADTFKRATGEEKIVGDMKDFCDYFAEKMALVGG